MMGTTVERCGGLRGGFVPCRTQMGEKLASIINGSRLQGEMDQMWLLVELVPQKHELFVVHLESFVLFVLKSFSHCQLQSHFKNCSFGNTAETKEV